MGRVVVIGLPKVGLSRSWCAFQGLVAARAAQGLVGSSRHLGGSLFQPAGLAVQAPGSSKLCSALSPRWLPADEDQPVCRGGRFEPLRSAVCPCLAVDGSLPPDTAEALAELTLWLGGSDRRGLTMCREGPRAAPSHPSAAGDWPRTGAVEAEALADKSWFCVTHVTSARARLQLLGPQPGHRDPDPGPRQAPVAAFLTQVSSSAGLCCGPDGGLGLSL